ncbi:hypothetical protein E2C01_095152 [Portunus trituberculatus]|uniref:Ionotropic glutamate receptor C-terminal domain-containing protein n=1 Tax=Portunus trituberculatus TaxID=210409 RepID=A0A5B7JUJ9_PORTR|nr:hypothetical protein [Portunus trituberculatus]
MLWERILLGVWILITLVLAKSYEGNLMSLLAVRHVPQPFQSLREVLDDPSIIMIWEEGGSNTQLIIGRGTAKGKKKKVKKRPT